MNRPQCRETDLVILAFGFEPSPVPGGAEDCLERTGEGTCEVDANRITPWPGVFAGGDLSRGADLLVTALRDGSDAAEWIERYLRGEA